MEANELMIGDWVYDTILKGNTRVEMLSSCMIKGYFNEKVWDENTFEPIPLTPEILEKNGFVYNNLPFEQAWEQFGLSLYRGGNGFRVNCGQNVALCIDSVHQLQHTLRLCGIEKEITL